MSRRDAVAAAVFLLGALTGAAAEAAAQDIELRAGPGVRVPDGYYEMIRRNPGLFEVDGVWSGARAPTPSSSHPGLSGTLNLVVVQALFSDSPEPWMTADDVQRILFDGPAPYGTVTEYYREVSRGRLTVTGAATPWVRSSMKRAEVVGEAYGLGPTSRVGHWVAEAVERADAHVDYTRFDNDGPDGVPNSGDDDGYVDAVAVQFLEIPGSCGGDGIWPHRSRISGWIGEPYSTDDIGANGQPIRVDNYITQSTVDCTGTALQTAGTITHELGHIFGLPDLYHSADGLLPGQRRWVVGCWTLMAAGSWGCGDGSTWPTATRPPHMGAWEKIALGWVNEEVVGPVRDHEFVLQAVQTSGRTLRVPLGPVEMLLMEYRPQIGYDVGLPASGVLIYHVDYGVPLYPAAGQPRIYRIALKEADGDSALIRTAAEGGDRGVAGDAWGLDGRTALSAITQPALRTNSGALTTVTIHSITVAGDVARIRISTAPTPAFVGEDAIGMPVALQPMTREVRVAGGTLPYTWSIGDLPAGLEAEHDDDLLTLRGTPLAHGRFAVAVRITDGRGVATDLTLDLTVASIALDDERLLQPLLRNTAEPLSDDERAYLDRVGNGNGRYDVGDLRRALRRE